MVNSTASALLKGMVVSLERTTDRPCRSCGATLVVVGEPKGPHLAALYCTGCDRHRGWLSKQVADFLIETVRLFGAPDVPLVVRDSSLLREGE